MAWMIYPLEHPGLFLWELSFDNVSVAGLVYNLQELTSFLDKKICQNKSLFPGLLLAMLS
jgi:hypothetical protein